MHRPGRSTDADCRCCGARRCPASESTDRDSLRGWRLTLSSAAIFVAPVVLGLAGAMCVRASEVGQLAGAVIGLAAGMGCAAAVARYLNRRHRVRA